MYKFLKKLSIISIGLILLGTIAFAEDTRILKFGDNLEFGSVKVGESVSRDLILYNEGNATLNISKLRFHQRIKVVYSGDWSGDIEPGESQHISITFTPNEAKRYNGLVYVESDKTNSGDYSRLLKGEGTPLDDINCTKILKFGSHLKFGQVQIGESATQEITLYNKGTCPLTIEKFKFHNRIKDVFSGDFNGSIEVGGSKTATITFTPTENKRYSGLVYVQSDRTNGGEYSRALIGEGIDNNNNMPPVANAGADQTVADSTQVQLDGSASSDADSDPLTYQWTMTSKPNGSSATLSDATLVNPTFVADVNGTYDIQLVVNDGHVNSVVDTVVITVDNNHLEGSVTITIEKVDKQDNNAKVHIVTDINEATYVFDNNKNISMDEGTVHDGYIILHSGKHLIKVCSDEPGTICSFEQGILVSHTVEEEAYKKYSIEIPAGGLTNNGTQLVYAGRDGIYTYNLSSQISTLLVSTGNSAWTGGLAYVNDTIYYFSKSRMGTINKINTSTEKINILAHINFPDGLDIFNNKIYAVTNDRSGELSIFNLAGEKIGALATTVPDITGITHTHKYLYILSEDGNIFQVNPTTGVTNQIFINDNLFTKGNNSQGLEAITILNNYIYVSYIDDISIYKIDINLKDYE